MEIGDFGSKVLLTGAGFSKPFGGRLAREVWSDLIGFPSVQNDNVVKRLLLENQNYEEALGSLLGTNGPDQHYIALEEAIYHSFSKMDGVVSNSSFGKGYGVNVYAFQDFLNSFRGKDASYLFTLNQDLLVERRYYNHPPGIGPQRPGIPPPPGQMSTNVTWFAPHRIQMDDSQLVGLPDEDIASNPPQLRGYLNYIKLHGSFDWRTTDKGLMVMGVDKIDQIAKSPLLKWYADVFETVVCTGDVRIMAVGYSFYDLHINRVLAKAVRECRAKVYIWNTNVDGVRKALEASEDGKCIWSSLLGFCSDSMESVFPGSQDKTEIYSSMRQTFFGLVG